MAPHPIEGIFETVLNDKKFSVEKFCSDKFGEFWKTSLDYLKMYSVPVVKGFFKKLKYVKLEGLMESMEIIVSGSKNENYSNDVIKNVNSVMMILLHHNSPENYRLKASNLLFKIFSIVDGERAMFFGLSFSYVIPFIRFCRNDEEKLAFESDKSGIQPIIQQIEDFGTVKSAEQTLMQFNNFLINNWEKRGPQCCCIWFQNVLAVLFRKIAISVQIPIEPYGFMGAIQPVLQDFIFNFFEMFCQTNNTLEPIAQSPEMTKFFFFILKDLIENSDFQKHRIILPILTRILCSSNMASTINSFGSDLFFEIPQVSVQMITNIRTSDVSQLKPMLQDFNKFCYSFYISLLELFPVQEAVTQISNIFKKFATNKTVVGLFLISLFPIALSPNYDEQIFSNAIKKIICSSDLMSAVTTRYAQYLAIYGFSDILGIDTDNIVRVCKEYRQRRTWNKMNAKCDWVADNIEKIVSQPNECPKPEGAIEMDILKENYQIYNMIVIPPPTFPNKMNAICKFLRLLRRFVEEKKMDEQRRLFTPFLMFCSILEELRYVPSEVQVNTAVLFDLISKELFFGVVSLSDNTLKQKSFVVLERLINSLILNSCLNQERVIQWYTVLILTMLSDVVELKQTAFLHSIRSIEHGSPYSSILCPLILSLIEEKTMKINIPHMTFLSSLAYFKSDPSHIISTPSIISFIEMNSMLFCENSVELLMKNSENFRQRVIRLISDYHFAAKSNRRIGGNNISWSILLPCYQIIIADELSFDQPNTTIVSTFLNFIVDATRARSYESLIICRSSLQYSEKLLLLCSDHYKSYIEGMIEIIISTNQHDSAEWIMQLSHNIMLLIIYSSKLIYGTNKYESFIHFLGKLMSQQNAYTEFPADLFIHINRILYTLSCYQSAYPFPSSIHFPCNKSVSEMKKCVESIFFTQTNALLHCQANNDEHVLRTNIIPGQFEWHFKDVSSLFHSNHQELEFSFLEISDTLTRSSSQTGFCSKFDAIVSNFETVYHKEYPIVGVSENPTMTKEVSRIKDSYTESINSETKEVPILSRPSSKVYNIITGSMTACGFVPKSYPFPIKRVSPGNGFSQEFLKIQAEPNRFQTSVSIIYVPISHSSGKEILSITMKDASPHFHEFLFCLGWPIDMESHIGYCGGFRNAHISIQSSLYYSDLQNEIMFHVAPLIPSSNGFESIQNLISSNSVMIVWCEKGEEYDLNAIPSEQCQVFILIYPLKSGLFRVNLVWKEDVGWFGPLRDPIVVSKSVLPSLIRETALCIQITLTNSISAFGYPQKNRKMQLDKLVSLFSVKLDEPRSFIQSLLKIDTYRAS